MGIEVSVIIVNYNTKDLLANCLTSIFNNTKDLGFEIIVVDNDSHDGSQDMIKRDFPNVKLIESRINLGFGKANNLGSSIAKGKYLFYLNSDTLLRNNAIKIFFDCAEKGESTIGALGCILTGSDGDTCHSYGKMITMLSELRAELARYFRFLKYQWLIKPPRRSNPLKVDYITGADLFVPITVFKNTGGFDSDFFMYCEEVDWQKRMAKQGLECMVIPGPEIIHLEGGSDTMKGRIWSKSRTKNIFKSRRIFYKKHFNKFLLPFFLCIQWMLRLPLKLVTNFK